MTASYELSGEAAPPMVNGELVFDSPWQGRIFGMARGLAEQGIYTWDEFRVRLIDQIAFFESSMQRDINRSADHGSAVSGLSTPKFLYYDHFLSALEILLVERSIVAPGELKDRVRAFADRPHDHDHNHDHDHDHDADGHP